MARTTRVSRFLLAVLPWALASLVAGATLDAQLARRGGDLILFEGQAAPAPKRRAPERKTNGVNYEPWEKVPS